MGKIEAKSTNDAEILQTILRVVDGVAQWLGRRSLAGGLSLIYA